MMGAEDMIEWCHMLGAGVCKDDSWAQISVVSIHEIKQYARGQ